MKLENESTEFDPSTLPAFPTLAPGDEPLDHPRPTWEQYVAHTRLLLKMSSGGVENLHPPRNEARFRLD